MTTPDTALLYAMVVVVVTALEPVPVVVDCVSELTPVPKSIEYTRLVPDGSQALPLGSAAAFIGDFDGDGLEDFAALGLHPSAPSHCRVLVCSGANREVLLDELCETPSGAAPVVAGAGDIDGDGRADLLVGVPQVAPSSSRVGHVRVFLGR